jgi:hypothetical protein
MSRLGYQHEAAINGLIALNKYKESPATFKVILMGTYSRNTVIFTLFSG